jgi:hypothetical protein
VQCLAVRTNTSVNIKICLVTADAPESLAIVFDSLNYFGLFDIFRNWLMLYNKDKWFNILH